MNIKTNTEVLNEFSHRENNCVYIKLDRIPRDTLPQKSQKKFTKRPSDS